jgi:HSP20 family protein
MQRSEMMALGYLTPLRRGSLSGGGAFGTGSLFDLHRQMNRLFDDLFDSGDGAPALGRGGGAAPALEVHQDDDKVEISAELPGVRQEDIDLMVEDGVLILRGEKRTEKTDEQRGYSERSYGSFERRIALPANVDEERCSAEFRDGVLTVTLPRSAEKQRGRRIPLGQSGEARPQIEAQNDTEEPSRQQVAQESARGNEQDDGQQS